MPRLFQPLSGAEICQMIQRKIATVMENDQAFRQHLTYPTIRWRWALEMDCSPNEPSAVRVEAQGTIQNPGEPMAVVGGGPIAEPPKEPSSITIADEQDIRAGHPSAGPEAKAPDTAREEHDMPVIEQTTVKVGSAAMIFDQVRQAKSRGGRAAPEAAELAK